MGEQPGEKQRQKRPEIIKNLAGKRGINSNIMRDSWSTIGGVKGQFLVHMSVKSLRRL